MDKVVATVTLLALVPCVLSGLAPRETPSKSTLRAAPLKMGSSPIRSASGSSAPARELPWSDIPALDAGMVKLCACLGAEDNDGVMEDIFEIFEDIVTLIADIESGELTGCQDIMDKVGEIAEDLEELVVEDLGLPLLEHAEDGVKDFFDLVEHVLCGLSGPAPRIPGASVIPDIPVVIH